MLQFGVFLQAFSKKNTMKLKSVSFAVLGQLAFCPWAAYELVKEMRRNFHYFYPRAESGLYEQLKKMEQAGFVRSEKEAKGKAERTIYSITNEGREALRQWLGTEPERPWLEFEGLLRLFLAKFGDRAMLHSSLAKTRSENETLLKLAEKVRGEYLQGIAPGQAEIVERACVFDFLLNFALMYRDWLDRTEAYLAVTDVLPPEEAVAFARKRFESHPVPL